MYTNIGNKIKVLAKVSCWVGIVGSVIFAFTQPNFVIALLIIIAGSLISWISSFTLYGFGQLIENSDILVEQGKNKPTVEIHTPTYTPEHQQKNPTPKSNYEHKWRCPDCGNMISGDTCPYCEVFPNNKN